MFAWLPSALMTEGEDDDKRSLSRRQLLGGVIVSVGVAACSKPEQGASPAITATGTPTASPSRSPSSRPISVATENVPGPPTGPAVALTFHGAGDVSLARSLLAEAERAGATLTVLAVGTWVQAEPAIATRILDGGHELGNHTFHPLPMRQLSAAKTLDEIRRCADELRRLTGSSGKWFRPSGTPHATHQILTAATTVGYRHSLSYDVDPRDYQDPGADAVVSRVLAQARPGSIVSLHLGHAGTVKALPAILDGLKGRGLKAVTTSALLS